MARYPWEEEEEATQAAEDAKKKNVLLDTLNTAGNAVKEAIEAGADPTASTPKLELPPIVKDDTAKEPTLLTAPVEVATPQESAELELAKVKKAHLKSKRDREMASAPKTAATLLTRIGKKPSLILGG